MRRFFSFFQAGFHNLCQIVLVGIKSYDFVTWATPIRYGRRLQIRRPAVKVILELTNIE